MRIISLVPSITKTLCDLGLKNQIVGITNFCIDPADLHRTAVRVGGTKDPDLHRISELSPTHIILNEEENRAVDIASLRAEFNTLVTFPKTPRDVPIMVRQIGAYLGVEDKAQSMASDIQNKIERVIELRCWQELLGKRFLYLIWRDPWMAAGKDTYISNFLELTGLENVLNSSERYPVVDLKNSEYLNPDVILLSSEPWPFRKRDAEHIREILGPSHPKLWWIDGKALSWYGSTTDEALTTISEDPIKNRLIKPL
jgi:iron complex transport system substrate-binding protein